MKRTLTLMLTALVLCTLLFGCGQKNEDGNPQDNDTESALADGVYTADFNTDSSMFHVNEACEGKGTLTVENGQMTIHISLPSKSILNLFCGTAEDARKDGAALLQPTTDTVTYSDGLSEEVNGFDIPVPALDEEFDVAIIGTKGKWYDHKDERRFEGRRRRRARRDAGRRHLHDRRDARRRQRQGEHPVALYADGRGRQDDRRHRLEQQPL